MCFTAMNDTGSPARVTGRSQLSPLVTVRELAERFNIPAFQVLLCRGEMGGGLTGEGVICYSDKSKHSG